MSRVDRRNRFAIYFARRGWIHALLLLCVWLFMFPFFWMLAMSVETEREFADGAAMPALVKYRPAGPYVREVGEAIKPPDVSPDRWRAVLPLLEKLAAESIAQSSSISQNNLLAIDSSEHRRAAAALLVSRTAARLDRRLWTADDATLARSFRSEITDAAIKSAISNSLGRIELLNFQLKSLDGHIYDLTRATAFSSAWRVETGDAKLLPLTNATLVKYRFGASNDPPITLRFDFDLPAGVTSANIHALIVSLVADNSWHRVDFSLDVAGERWQSDETNYLAEFGTIGLAFQPPGFDDQSLRAKSWTTLRKTGRSNERSGRATARLMISPSSALRADSAKLLHNFDSAFKSVPFWRYIFNSLLLVVLSTAGALFSATFVAYAFARLNWPGRSAAFLLLLATMMLPGQVTMIPGFLIWRFVHWYNTLNPLWVPSFLGSAFFIFLMTQHMRTIPRELEEAARIDGLGALQSWYYIILPNVKPSLAAITILSFIGSWNEFMGPLIYLRDQTRFPLSLGLYGLNLMHALDPTLFPSTMIMAGNVLMTLPVIGVFLLFQRYFVRGMSMTGLKS